MGLKAILTSLFVLMRCIAPGVAFAQENFPEGSLWRATGDERVYVISNGLKRHIPNETVFRSYGWDASAVREADPDILFAIPDVRVVRTSDNPAVYDIVTGKRQLIRSEEEFLDRGFSWEELISVNGAELDSYPLEVVPETGSSAAPPSVFTPSPVPAPIESALLVKIREARLLLQEAAPSYPRQKQISGNDLKRGSRGEAVKKLQDKLKDLGYFPLSTAANGIFGPATEKAVENFQRDKSISATGVVGPQTRNALKEEGFDQFLAVQQTWKDVVPRARTVLLAAWNESTDKIDLVRVELAPHNIKIGKRTATVYAASSLTPGFSVRYRGGNGVNVHYEIASPPGYKVLANRYPIFDNAPGKKGTWPPEEVVYVPYSDELRTPETVAAGKRYLDEAVAKALEQLRAKQVPSVSGRGLVGDLANTSEMKNIAIIEHIDHGEFRRSEDKHGVVNKVFAVLGTNREMAYRFSGSSKGALGLAQFIRSTYNIIRKQYADAQLIPDFEEGMANHVNAFQAMALYLDISGTTLEPFARQYISRDHEELAVIDSELRAGAYNGGAGRVKNTVKALGPQWSVDKNSASLILKTNIASIKKQIADVGAQIKKTAGEARTELRAVEKELKSQLATHQVRLSAISRYSLRAETVTYLEKYRVVREILKAF